jgi:hypothetical protein
MMTDFAISEVVVAELRKSWAKIYTPVFAG